MTKKYLIVTIAIIAAVAGIITLATKNSNSNTANKDTANQAKMLDGSQPSPVENLNTKTGDAYDEAFIVSMSEHHAGAVVMAGFVDTEAKHPELRQLAINIIASQSKELADMKAWATQWGYKYTDPPQLATDAMTASLKGKTGDDLDKQFISEMIGHHKAAVSMAFLSDSNAKHPEMKALSKSITADQNREIADMESWAKQWGYNIDTAKPGHNVHGQ